MSMTTRLQSKVSGENAEARKLTSKQQPTLDVKEKRKAFGDIHNKATTYSSSNDDNHGKAEKPKTQTLITAVYKDVKPRVDTRWKKPEAAIGPKRTSSTSSTTAAAAVPKPLLKPTLKTKAETITMQKTKPLTKPAVANVVVPKKEDPCVKPAQEPLIKSPVNFKLKFGKIGDVQNNYYESHSSKLLGQIIEDIDSKDANNPQLLPEYTNDIYNYLFKLESIFPIRENFLADQMDVTPKMRSVLLDWINEVHHQFQLEPETYHMTVSMIDRFLQAQTTTPRRYLQLVGVTCLFMASKFEELMPPDITDFVYVTDDTYTKEQILAMEKKVVEALGFNLSKPLPIHFLRRFAKAAGSLGDRQYLASKYFVELASIDYEMTKYKPSEVAAASLFLALTIFNAIKSDKDLWTPTLEHYTTYTAEQLKPILKRLATLASTAKDTKLKAVFTKYASGVSKFISTAPEMTGIKMNEIVTRC